MFGTIVIKSMEDPADFDCGPCMFSDNAERNAEVLRSVLEHLEQEFAPFRFLGTTEYSEGMIHFTIAINHSADDTHPVSLFNALPKIPFPVGMIRDAVRRAIQALHCRSPRKKKEA